MAENVARRLNAICVAEDSALDPIISTVQHATLRKHWRW